MANNSYVIEQQEDFIRIFGQQRYDELDNYAFEVCSGTIVIEGDVEIEDSIQHWCKRLKRKHKNPAISNFVCLNNLSVNRMEFAELQLIVLGKTKCTNFIEDSYNYFYGEDVEVEEYAIFNRTSGCVIINEISVPVLISSENYPIIKNLTSKTMMLTDDDGSFIRSGLERAVQTQIQALHQELIEAFDIEEFDDLVESIYGQREAFLDHLDAHPILA